MPSAKATFITQMLSFNRSINSDAVTNRVLTERAHNEVARMLRNGLAVVGFAALEDFIKKTTSEVLTQIGTFGIRFSELPEKLQQAATYEAIGALNFQLGLLDKADKIPYVQEHASKIASTATTPWELTTHALGYSKSNLNAEAVKSILNTFTIVDSWGQMTRLGARIGLVSLPLDETFKSAALRRHRAAHTPLADTPQSDLQQFVKEGFAIAMAFDCLIQRASKLIRLRDANFKSSGLPDGYANSVRIRTVTFAGGKWKEHIVGRTGAIRASIDEAAITAGARTRAITSGDFFVIFDNSGQISTWDVL